MAHEALDSLPGSPTVWDSIIGAASRAIVGDFVPGPFDLLPRPLLVVGLHPFPYLTHILLMHIRVIVLQALFRDFAPPDGRPAIAQSKEQ